MKFLTELDIDIIIKPNYFQQIVVDNAVINQAERIAIAEASSYITQRYETDYLYRPYVVGASGSTIEANQRLLWTDGLVYVNGLTGSVILDSEIYPGSTFSATQSWLDDDRQPHLVEITTHIFIWILANRVEPRRIEEIRKYNYDMSLEKLKQYAHGDTSMVGIVVGTGLRADNQGVSVYYGSDYNTIFDINYLGVSNRPGIYGSYSNMVPNPFYLQGYAPGT
jgi:hypothetical protein